MCHAAAALVCLAVATTGCTARTAPAARRVGQVLAIAGVVGLVGTVAAAKYIDGEDELMGGFSLMSGGGILTFAAGELSVSTPALRPETETEKHNRWARILTERAAGAAREGRCPRVRRLERRVLVYDKEVHDFVFMRDPEILRCLDPASAPAIVDDDGSLPQLAVPAATGDSTPPPLDGTSLPTLDGTPNPAPPTDDGDPAPLPRLPHLP